MDLQVRYPDYKFENGVDVLVVGRDNPMRVFGLAKYNGGHLVIAHDYKYGDKNYYKMSKFRNAVNTETGEIITKIKEFVLSINPDIFDIRPEFERIDELKMKHGLLDN
jgi:hypothetical protein